MIEVIVVEVGLDEQGMVVVVVPTNSPIWTVEARVAPDAVAVPANSTSPTVAALAITAAALRGVKRLFKRERT